MGVSWYACSGGSLRDSGRGLVNGNGGRGGRMSDTRGGDVCVCMVWEERVGVVVGEGVVFSGLSNCCSSNV